MKITRKGYYTISIDGILLTKNDKTLQVTSRDEAYERITEDGREGVFTIYCPNREVEIVPLINVPGVPSKPPSVANGGPGTTGNIIIRDHESGVVDATADLGDPGFDGTGDDSVFKSSPTNTGSRSIQCNATDGEEGFGKFGGSYSSSVPNFGEGDEMWWRCHNYWPSGFNFNTTSGQGLKHMRFHVAESDLTHIGYISTLIKGTGSDPSGLVTVDSEVQGTDFKNNIWPNNPTLPDLRQGLGTAVARDTWICYENYVLFHATDTSAIWRVWQDGVLIFEDLLTATFRNSTDVSDFFYFYTNWNGGPDGDEECYVDDVIIVRNGSPDGRDTAGNKMIGPTGWVNP